VVVFTFNYDRSLEHFLYLAYHSLGGRSSSDPHIVADRMRNLGFLHIHGSFSPLPWQNGNSGRPYGPTIDKEVIRECGRRILFTGDSAESEFRGEPPSYWLDQAEQIFFLGFGFDPANLKRLGMDKIEVKAPKYMGFTSMGMTEHRITELRQQYHCVPYPSIEVLFDTFNFEFAPSKTP